MAVEQRPKMPQSHIPVKAPRPSQSTLPSSLSAPSLGLTPSSRLLAVSGSPTHPPVSTSPSSSSGFRSFRSLLSFGPGKSNGNSSSSPSSAGPSRTSFGVLRKSTNGERSVSAPQLPALRSQEALPVLAIELSHRVDQPLIDNEELKSRLLLDPRTPENASPISTLSALSSRSSYQATDMPATPPTALGASELSTILEAETSGISKHLPNLDDSLDIPTTRSSASRASQRSPRSYSSRRTDPELNDTSVLDLSTSNVTNEVLAALSASGPKAGWLNGVVVDSPPDGDAGDASFNLNVLDPDLAALLSPNRITEPEPALLVSIGAISPPLPTPPLTATRRNTPDASPRMSINDLESRTKAPSTGTSPVLANRPAAIRNPPLARSGSMPQASSSKLVPARLARSTQYSAGNSPLPSPTRLSESSGRPSLQLPRRRQSPLLAESALPPRPTSAAGTESEAHRSAASRLATPSRHLAAVNSARAATRLLPSPQSSPGYDASESTTSRSPTSATGRRVGGIRPSLDSGPARPRLFTRDRSASLTEGTNFDGSAKRPVDWLGPRTAKAFAAAGLIDSEREKDSPGSSVSRPGSRFGYGSTRSERDYRSQYAPSRAGFSDASSPSTWGRRSGSISRTVASSEAVSSLLGTPLSDSASTPRTTFSGTSTAATSVSGVSSVHRHLHDELSSMHEKHSLETGALLSALADSQRTSRMLREENAQLRDRLNHVEQQLAAAQDELHRQQFNPPMTSTLGRNTFHRLAGQGSADTSRRPYTSHSRLQTFHHPSLDKLPDEKTQINARPDAAAHSHASYDAMPMPSNDASSYKSANSRRYSGSSSIFPVPPTNMTMLTNEMGTALSSTSTPPSPTLVVGRPFVKAQSGHHRTTSSIGNISPTTANFSIMTGSPGSLNLRPEHEDMLGDMPTLHLYGDYDPDSYS